MNPTNITKKTLMHPFTDCICLWVFTQCQSIFDSAFLKEKLELWSYKFSTIIMNASSGQGYLDKQTWAYFLATCEDVFSSILTSSTKLETVSITLRALNWYGLLQTRIIHGPIKSTAHYSIGIERNLSSGNKYSLCHLACSFDSVYNEICQRESKYLCGNTN